MTFSIFFLFILHFFHSLKRNEKYVKIGFFFHNLIACPYILWIDEHKDLKPLKQTNIFVNEKSLVET